MTIWTALAIGGAILLGVSALFGGMVFLLIRGISRGAPIPTPTSASGKSAATTTSGTTASSAQSFKDYLPWLIGAGVVAILAVGIYLTVGKGIDVVTLIVGAVLLGIAIYGGVKHAGKGSKYITWLVVASLVGFMGLRFYYGDEAPTKIKEWQESNQKNEFVAFAKGEREAKEPAPSAATAQPKVREGKARWDNVAGNTLPVNVWSEAVKVDVGCTITYAAGDGEIYRIQYRFYNIEWRYRTPGTSTSVSEIRFMMLRPNITELPYKISC